MPTARTLTQISKFRAIKKLALNLKFYPLSKRGIERYIMSKKVEDIKQKVNQKHIEFYDKTLSVLEFMLDEYAREIKYAEFEFIDAPKNSLAMIDFLISAIGKVQKGQRLALGLDDDVVVNEEPKINVVEGLCEGKI